VTALDDGALPADVVQMTGATMTDAEVTGRLAAARAEARRRVPAWQPWMREWCDETNWGEKKETP
jgi:hypothetical protein